MNKITYNRIYCLLLLCMATAFTLSLPACKKDLVAGPPVITEVRNYVASPGDSSQVEIKDGQWVIVMGKNLKDVQKVYFGGIPASINATLLTNESIVVQVPAIPFAEVPRDKVNEITVISEGGTFTYSINVTGAPLITHVRNYGSAPNDTLLEAATPGQHVNLIGFNLKGATRIAFQGVDVNLTEAVFTDSSVIVKLPANFSNADAALAHKVTYTTKIGTQNYSFIIFDPALLQYYKHELYALLAGGLDKEKTWVLDYDATGASKKFTGVIWWAGLDLGWNKQCGSGGSCWSWTPDNTVGWFTKVDYGTMTFKLKGKLAITPSVTVLQKGLGNAEKNGTFTGGYFLDVDAKTITFASVVPLNLGSNYVYTKAYIISLTEDGMQLGFKDPVKSEYAVHNYIKK